MTKDEIDMLQRKLLRLHSEIQTHGWSKRMTKYDGEFIGAVEKRIMELSNECYRINHPEVKP